MRLAFVILSNALVGLYSLVGDCLIADNAAFKTLAFTSQLPMRVLHLLCWRQSDGKQC